MLMVLPELDQGGIERGTVDLARHLIERGWRALVASNGGAGEAELKDFGARCFRLPVHSRNPLIIRANIRRLQRLIRDHDVRVVHAGARAPAWSACYAARRCKVPFVTAIHGVYDGGRGILTRRFNAIMARGDRVIAVSAFVAEHVRRHYGVPEERLRVIRRGIDMGRFDPEAVEAQRIASLAEQWRVSPGTKVLMLPGASVRRHGHRLLLQAIARLPLGLREQFAVFGRNLDGALLEAILARQLVQELGVDGQVGDGLVFDAQHDLGDPPFDAGRVGACRIREHDHAQPVLGIAADHGRKAIDAATVSLGRMSVEIAEPTGDRVLLTVRAGTEVLRALAPARAWPARVYVTLPPSKLHWFDAATERRLEVSA